MPIIAPVERKWVAFNHYPNGQMCVQHFDHSVREKKVGDSQTQKVTVTCDEQIRGFEQSDFVSLNMRGQIIRNKVLVYSGPAFAWNDPNASLRVLAWAEEMGLQPIRTAEEKKNQVPGTSDEKRLNNLEDRIAGIEKNNEETGKKIDQILAALAPAAKGGK